ncbi:MAG: OmpH family outer membrane protein [Xanthomonadales bacterium]|nr:OmpH family outer membrane protein [Xanthomonadales bacterium]
MGSALVYAQANPENPEGSSVVAVMAQKTAYANMKMILDNAPQIIAGRDVIDREFRPRNNAVTADEKRLGAIQERLNSDLDSVTRAQLDRDIRSLNRAIIRRKEDLIEEINFRRNEIENGVRETLELAIRIVAEQQGFDMVLTDPVVLYHSQRIDLTSAILKQLRLEYEADQQEQTSR